MALLTIPVTKDDPDYEFSIDLDKTIFLLRFTLNSRSGRWFMTIKSADGVVLLSPIPLMTNWLPLYRFNKSTLPLGKFVVMDTLGKNTEPNEENFGDTVVLLYQEALSE